MLHKALVSKLGFGDSTSCPELTGRDDAGRPLQGHRHAHILPVDLDQDGHLDHIVLFAHQKFGPIAQQAIRSVKRTYTKGGVGELQVALAGSGSLESMRRLPGSLGRSVDRLLGLGAVWTSETPFVPPRHAKVRGSNTVEGQVLAELNTRGFPEAEVIVLPWDSRTRGLRWFVRRRSGRSPQPAVDEGYALKLVFNQLVSGPICLGYASHFGLGRFAAEAEPGAIHPTYPS
jgi:CRISPR-associated protein Csb2